MSHPILYLGNKNYSSWSLRPWLALQWGGIAFEERVIPLQGPGYGKGDIPAVKAISPSGRVPALHSEGVIINDSLAICEWAAELQPMLWPVDRQTRALARAAAAEMHSGFAAVRRDLSMNIRRRLEVAPTLPDDTRADLARLFALWTTALDRFGGPWLFGTRSIADAMYAPVATRLRTYNIVVPDAVQRYCKTVLEDAAFLRWEAEALKEPWTIDSTEALYSR